MVVLNIAVIGSDDLAKSIAKAADQRDVHTYVHKENGPDGARILSLIRPAKYPERLPPFLNALSTSQAGIVEVTAVDANLGEVLVAFASAGITRGLAVINPPEGQWVDETQVKMLFDQAGLADWTFEANDGVHLRERMYALMDEIQAVLEANANAPLVLPVDQHFNVKGIGLVAIGYVQSGRVKVHDEVLLLPADGTGNAKSLQVMDDDVEVASAGDRVGLALRNAKEDHLTGSTIIVHPPVEDKRANVSIPLAVEQHGNLPGRQRGQQHDQADAEEDVGRISHPTAQTGNEQGQRAQTDQPKRQNLEQNNAPRHPLVDARTRTSKGPNDVELSVVESAAPQDEQRQQSTPEPTGEE